ncbi:MAG: NAD(P)H-binding protein [Thermoleophilia bacterium]|nr:NAD(P)H-binding protein [Thermoleophilia bacterium]
MILLTGATGSIGSRLLPRLLASGEEVRCLVREPRRLGDRRVEVQITMGDLRELSDPYLLRQALRGVDTVIHLAASIRDQPPYRVEELNGLATVRLLEAAEKAGARRFIFFSALNTSAVQRTRFFRAKWIAEQAVLKSSLDTTIFRPSIVFDHSDPWITLVRRLSFLPAIPVSGSGNSRYQPIWADDVARAVETSLGAGSDARPSRKDGSPVRHEYDLAGPETLTYSEMTELVGLFAGRPRPVLRLPLPLVHLGLTALHRIFKEAVFATWQEAELMRVSMVSASGTADAEALGVSPRPMATVLAEAPGA